MTRPLRRSRRPTGCCSGAGPAQAFRVVRKSYDARNDTKGHEHPIGGHFSVAVLR